MKNCYALLIGIDQYQSDIPNLNGCVLDATSWHQYLQKNLNTDRYQLHSKLLLTGSEQLPTRQHIITAIQQHLGQAQIDDMVLLFYAGHGSKEKAPAYFGETDGHFQTLVPCDARQINPTTQKPIKNILDKELRYLFYQIWQKNQPEIIFIQDSCHSTGATRFSEQQALLNKELERNKQLLEAETKTKIEAATPIARYTPPNADERNGSNWQLLSAQELAEQYTAFDTSILEQLHDNISHSKTQFNTILPEAKHIHLAACGKQEYAYEVAPSGGVFTHTLIKILTAVNNSISYHDLFSRIRLSIGGVYQQSPSLHYNKTDSSGVHQAFLGDLLLQNKLRPYRSVDIFKGFFPVIHNRERGWHIAANEMTLLPALSDDIPIEIFHYKNKPKGQNNAWITKVTAQYSQITFFPNRPAPQPEKAAVLYAMIPPQYMRRWRAKVAVDTAQAVPIFEIHFQDSSLAKERHRGLPKLQWVAEQSQADYYIQQKGDWLNCYNTKNQLLLSSSATTLTDGTVISLIQKTTGEICIWSKEKEGKTIEKHSLSVQPLNAANPILTQLLSLFEQQQKAIKITAIPENSTQNTFELFLNKNKKSLQYYQAFINWQPYEKADFVVETYYDGFEVYEKIEGELMALAAFRKTKGLGTKQGFQLIVSLQKISKWLTVQKLYNKVQTTVLEEHDFLFELTFYQDRNKTKKQKISLNSHDFALFENKNTGRFADIEIAEQQELKFLDNAQPYLPFELNIQHQKGTKAVYYSALLLNDNYGIMPLQSALGCNLLPIEQTAALLDLELRKPAQMVAFPQEQGEAIYYIKIFVAFERFDISGFLQKPLPAPTSTRDSYRKLSSNNKRYQIANPPPISADTGMWATFTIPLIVV